MIYLNQNQIISKKIKNQTTIDFLIHSPLIASEAKPGQFVTIKCGAEHLLRRPISICDVEGDNIRIIFEVRGKGTEYLASLNVGDKMDILGPLGNGFTLIPPDKKVLLVGGGIGTYPLFFTSKHYKNPYLAVGFRNKELIYLTDDFENHGTLVHISTDDGSFGKAGFVTGIVEEILENEKIDMIYTCGPAPMMREIVALSDKLNVACQVSLEERMACGMGACVGCSCKLSGEKTDYARVCKDGPCFDKTQVII